MGEFRGTHFRWQYQADSIGEDWTDWHTVEGPCSACCHGGPHGGEHQQGAGYYDEDGVMDWYAHTRCDQLDPDEIMTVEWRAEGGLP